MIFPLSDESPLFHDLTGPHGCSLLPVAAEMRAREAARKARAARWRRSWPQKAGSWLRSILWRGDQPRTRPPEANPAIARACPGCGGGLAPEEASLGSILDELGVGGLLAVARAAALREGRPDLARAVHTILLLEITGNLDDMAELVATVQAVYCGMLGDQESVH